MRTQTPMTRANGFSLLEVMVAVIVICVGLLGIAKMQSLALSNTTVSRQRALAAAQAASIASAMHSNRDYWNNVAPTNYSITITSNPTTVTVPTDAQLQADTTADIGTAPAINACVATAVGAAAMCTPEQLAAFDLARWWANSLQLTLPNPSANIACAEPPAGNPGPMACTIQISWTEKAVAINAQQLNTGQFDTPTYTLYVEP
jgi:type IV pilus assembly protein PilV